MAFATRDLELLAGGGVGACLWAFKSTADAKATVDTSGYFNSAKNDLKVGDFMLINASDGYGISVVLSNDGTTVDVSDLTAVGGTDTD